MKARQLQAAIVALAAAACSSPAVQPQQSASTSCEGLSAFREAGVNVTAAASVLPSPEWQAPGPQGRGALPVTTAFCRVEGMIEGRVGFELWLPAREAWNGRLLGAGVGGDAGVYNLRDLARGVEAGFASVTNDSGHKASEANWMMREEAIADYTHRSQHMMNVAARGLIDAYYGDAPHHAYFLGCSGGGRQALKEMQLYPLDYDGVIAGAPGPTMPTMSVRHLWQGLYQERNPAGALTDADWDIVADAAVAACDKNDGVVDGVVETPSRCTFDPGDLVCIPEMAGACLSPDKVATVRAFYAPLRDEDGKALDSGLFPGVRTRPGPPSPLLLPFFAHGAHRDPDWSTDDFHRGHDLALAHERMPEMRADNPDLRPFANRGGRAIIYQGWLDPSIVAGMSLDYLDNVRRTMDDAEADKVLKLYMVPGMLHCRGGDGVDRFGGAGAPDPIGDPDHDILAAMIKWVEQGETPGAITASRVEGGRIVRQRPVCPYPQEAIYKGGDTNLASSFRCERPQ